MGQLAEARQKIAKGSAEEEQAKLKLTMQQNELRNLEGKMKSHAKEAGDNAKKVELLAKSVKNMEAKVQQCGWDAEKEKELENKSNRGQRYTCQVLKKNCYTEV